VVERAQPLVHAALDGLEQRGLALGVVADEEVDRAGRPLASALRTSASSMTGMVGA